MPEFQLNRPLISGNDCVDAQDIAQALSAILDAIGNPGPPGDPADPATPESPCGNLVGVAYVRLAGATPELVYVDTDGVCQVITVSGGGGSVFDVVVATVDSNVAAAPGTFAATVTHTIQGTTVPTTAITVNNLYSRAYNAADKILAIKYSGTSDFVTVQDETAAYGGTVITDATLATAEFLVQFKLTEDLSRNQTSATAYANDLGANIYVLDPLSQFMGKADYTDDTGSNPAFVGYAVKATADYSGGIPGYNIIAMEGWHRKMVCTTTEKVVPTDTTFTVNVTDDYGSLEQGNRFPPVEDSTYDLTVQDPYNVVNGVPASTRVLVGLSDMDDTNGGPVYHVLSIVDQDKYKRIRGTAKGAVVRGATSFIIDNVEVLQGQNPAETAASEITVAVRAPYQMNIPDNAMVHAEWDAENGEWNAGVGANWYYIARGRQGFDDTKYMVLTNQSNLEQDMEWVETTRIQVNVGAPSVTLEVASGSLFSRIDFQTQWCRVIAAEAEVPSFDADDVPVIDCAAP